MKRDCGMRNAECGMRNGHSDSCLLHACAPILRQKPRGLSPIPVSAFRIPHLSRSAMTLVELLVVLAILALLTTVAVTSSDVVLSQGRHEAPVRTLRAIEEAVLGPQDASSTSDEPAAGFLADIGRLPSPPAGCTPAQRLAELWDQCAMEKFDVRRPDDKEVAVGCGWRGPYLRLPVGRIDLLDGWGRPFEVDVNGNNEIINVRSRGADDLPGTSDDLLLPLGKRVGISFGGNVYLLDSNGQRQNPTSGSTVRVVLFQPDGNTGLLQQTELLNPPTAGGTVVTYSGNCTIGPRYLRAYMTIDSASQKSNIVRIQHGGVIDLEIR